MQEQHKQCHIPANCSMAAWFVRKPATTIIDMAIKEFMQHRASAKMSGYRAMLADGSLVDRTLSIAQLGLGPSDVVLVEWDSEADTPMGNSGAAKKSRHSRRKQSKPQASPES